MAFYNRQLQYRNDARVQINASRGIRKPFQGANMFKVEIFGDAELDKLFRKLDYTKQRNILIAAFRRSVKPMKSAVLSALRGSTNRKSGNLFRSIGDYAPRDETVLFFGARRFGNFAGYHAHLIDAGTTQREYITKTGESHSTGSVKPTYFWSRSVSSTKGIVVDRFFKDRLRAFSKAVTTANMKAKT